MRILDFRILFSAQLSSPSRSLYTNHHLRTHPSLLRRALLCCPNDFSIPALLSFEFVICRADTEFGFIRRTPRARALN